MYRITKILNHNSILVVSSEDITEYLIMGKGIGFGKKIAQTIELGKEDTIYILQKESKRGDARELVRSIAPVFLEIANEILDKAEKVFGKVDRNILFPMADHIAFVVKRIQNGEQIRNPLTQDIQLMFHMEYNVAKEIQELLEERMKIKIIEDEIGYIALHIHSAIEDQNVSQAMYMAQAVRECVVCVEEVIGMPLNTMSLSYNRLMNHIKYMLARALKEESLKLNMNDYIGGKFPKAFQMAEKICKNIEKNIKCKLEEVEIGYLAMHLERVMCDELDKE